MRLSRFEIILLLASVILSLIFLNMFPVYMKKDPVVGLFLLVDAMMSMSLFFLMRWGYATLTEVMASTSIAVLLLLRPPTIYFGILPLSWWIITALYIVITITGIALTRSKDEKKLNIISIFFASVFLFMSIIAAYEGFKLPLPPDVIRGLSASTKIKTWRSMGVLLGLMNAGAAAAMLRGKYLHYLLLISFTLPPLFTVPLSFEKITFGVFSQVLLLVQIGVSGLIVSWYMGSKR